jgi:hypothetical protein
MFVSEDPDAKNSPKGWKSSDAQFDLCPVKVRTTAHNTIAVYVFNANAPSINTVHTFRLLNIPYFYCPTCSTSTYGKFRRVKAH